MDYPFEQSLAPMKVRSQIRSMSRPRDKKPTRQRKPKERRYVLSMSPGKDNELVPERAEALAAWIEQVFALFKERKSWSKEKVIQKSGVSRSAVFKWKTTAGSRRKPDPDLLDRFCANLHAELPSPLLDPSVPYGILGWGRPSSMAGARVEALAAQTPTALEGKIRRAKSVLKGRSLTPAQREKYEGMLRDFEAAYVRVIDTILEDLERDEADRGD